MFAKAQDEGEREELDDGSWAEGVVGDVEIDEVERGMVDGETSMESAVEVGHSTRIHPDFDDYGG
jgi:hypothetical protein